MVAKYLYRNLIGFIFFFSLNTYLFGQTIPDLKIVHLTENCYTFTSYTIYKGSPTPANGMYLVTDKGVVLIDCPWDPSQFQPLLDSIENRHHQKLVLAIATHSHSDRSGALEFLKAKGVKTFTSKQTDEISKQNKEKRAEFTFNKDTTFTVGDYKIRTCYAGPGHTKDNIVVWFEKDKVLFGGCLIKSVDAPDLGFTGEADLKKWPLTLRKVQQNFPKPSFVITGHDSWKSLNSINHTLQLLRDN